MNKRGAFSRLEESDSERKRARDRTVQVDCTYTSTGACTQPASKGLIRDPCCDEGKKRERECACARARVCLCVCECECERKRKKEATRQGSERRSVPLHVDERDLGPEAR